MKFPKRLSSGRYVDLGNFSSADVHLEDITPALQYLYRFTGHNKDMVPLTVAQHSILCCKLAETFGEDESIQLSCLTHDFAEAYIGDVSSPIKWLLGSKWKDFAGPIERAVNEALDPQGNDPEVHESVKVYDSMALDLERRCIWKSQRGKDLWPEPKGEYGDSLAEKRSLYYDIQCYGNKAPIDLLYKGLHKEVYG